VLDVERIRADFAPLKREIFGHELVYLDGAATSLTPEPVVESLARYYREMNANVHRGVHRMAEEATAAFEGTRDIVARTLGGVDPRGVVFTGGATEALDGDDVRTWPRTEGVASRLPYGLSIKHYLVWRVLF